VEEVLIGILLGDAHIQKKSSNGNSRLIYTQSATMHKEYFYYIYNIFKPLCVNNHIPYLNNSKDKRTNEKYSAITFATMSLPCFNIYRELFYTLNTKIVPEAIYKLLTAKSLAFWIMDDGSCHGKGLHISVYYFSTEDVDKLIYVLQDKFNLRCSIHYNKDKKPRIYIFKESMNNLKSLVLPYFINQMYYKLGL